MTGYQIIIEGRVQGVGFRNSAKQFADSLSLKGFVKNQADGSVLTEVFGKKHDLEEYIQWCHKGSSFSKITKVTFDQIPYEEYKNFTVKY